MVRFKFRHLICRGTSARSNLGFEELALKKQISITPPKWCTENMTVLKYDEQHILVFMLTKWCSSLYFLFVYWLCKYLCMIFSVFTYTYTLTEITRACFVTMAEQGHSHCVTSSPIGYELTQPQIENCPWSKCSLRPESIWGNTCYRSLFGTQ